MRVLVGILNTWPFLKENNPYLVKASFYIRHRKEQYNNNMK